MEAGGAFNEEELWKKLSERIPLGMKRERGMQRRWVDEIKMVGTQSNDEYYEWKYG